MNILHKPRKIGKLFSEIPLPKTTSSRTTLMFIGLAIVMAGITGVGVWRAIAASQQEVGRVQAERLNLPTSKAGVGVDSSASGRMVQLWNTSGTLTGNVTSYGTVESVSVRTRVNTCSGTSRITLRVNGKTVQSNYTINGTSWQIYNFALNGGAGQHSIEFGYSNSSRRSNCRRDMFLDYISLHGQKIAPSLTLSANATELGEELRPVTLSWSGSGVNSCVASGGWSGARYANGSFSEVVNPVGQTTYTLTCSGYGGTVTKSVTIDAYDPYPLTVGNMQQILSREQMEDRGLMSWPDSTMGVMKNGSTYTLYGPGETRKITRTTGTLDNPISGSVTTTLPINGIKDPNYIYYGGGTIYRDPASGMLLMFCHTERQVTEVSGSNWTTIALARSLDNGNSWEDLGEIVSPRLQMDAIPSIAENIDIGGGAHLVVGDYFYVYFADRLEGNYGTNLSVARAKVSDVVNAALASTPGVVEFHKYYNGEWNEPGMGGLSTRLEANGTSADFPILSYNSYLDKYILIASGDWPQTNLYMLFSDDGVTWNNRKLLESDPGEALYATTIGLGDEPKETGKDFYVYYMYSLSGGNRRWDDAILARRLISFE